MEKVEKRFIASGCIVVALLLAAIGCMIYTVDIATTDIAGINPVLPVHVGPWQGEDILFCQNPSCMREVAVPDASQVKACPACGGGLSFMTIPERDLLPNDTILVRKRYGNPRWQSPIMATIVLSGKDRASIHRPQMCLVGQGHEIGRSYVLEVPISNRAPLKAMVLDMVYKRQEDGQIQYAHTGYYAYWFVGKDRETPYHLQRLLWMAADRIFRSITHRWAYIALSGMQEGEEGEYEGVIKQFIADLYPQLAPGGPAKQ